MVHIDCDICPKGQNNQGEETFFPNTQFHIFQRRLLPFEYQNLIEWSTEIEYYWRGLGLATCAFKAKLSSWFIIKRPDSVSFLRKFFICVLEEHNIIVVKHVLSGVSYLRFFILALLVKIPRWS